MIAATALVVLGLLCLTGAAITAGVTVTDRAAAMRDEIAMLRTKVATEEKLLRIAYDRLSKADALLGKQP